MSDPPFALVALKRLLVGLFSTLQGQLISAIVFLVDLVLFIVNLITPDRPVGHVIPHGHPGAGGKWPAYIAPKQGDSRCSCPALNAMANHGALGSRGRNEASSADRRTFHTMAVW